MARDAISATSSHYSFATKPIRRAAKTFADAPEARQPMRAAPFTFSVDTADQSPSRWNRDWIKASVIGELIGFVPPAVAGAVLVALDASEIVLVGWLVGSGAFEGLILGRAQDTVLQTDPRVTGGTLNRFVQESASH